MRRANGTGSITRLSGRRHKPYMARVGGRCIGTYRTKAEAQEALEGLKGAQKPPRYNLTFAECYDLWKPQREREVGKTAATNYRTAYNQCGAIHNRRIREITRADLQACINALEDAGKSKSTCEKLKGLFSQIFRWAMMEGIISRSPADGLTVTAEQLEETPIFTDADIAAIKQSREPAADVALILISCGCRPGELFSVPLSACEADFFVGGSKTEAGKNRVIPVGPDGLKLYRIMRMVSPGPLLIDGYRGRNKSYPNFAKRDWRDLMQDIGRPEYMPYSCRHTFITRAIRGGMELPKLEAIVGHVSRETTRIYTHLAAGDLVESVTKVQQSKSKK